MFPEVRPELLPISRAPQEMNVSFTDAYVVWCGDHVELVMPLHERNNVNNNSVAASPDGTTAHSEPHTTLIAQRSQWLHTHRSGSFWKRRV